MVIIVEDDAEMRALLRDALRAERLPVREEPDGASLMERLEVDRPAVLVLDREMPGPGGLDLLAYVTRRHPTLPVILITAFGGGPVAAEARRLGATTYIEKPFSLDRFVGAVRELLMAPSR